jgi:hypothetical protein
MISFEALWQKLGLGRRGFDNGERAKKVFTQLLDFDMAGYPVAAVAARMEFNLPSAHQIGGGIGKG